MLRSKCSKRSKRSKRTFFLSCSLSLLVVLHVHQAGAVTYEYTSNPYYTVYGDLGTHLTASVTFDDSLFSDKPVNAFFQSTPASLTSWSIRSGSYRIASTDPSVEGFSADFQFSGSQIVFWSLSAMKGSLSMDTHSRNYYPREVVNLGLGSSPEYNVGNPPALAAVTNARSMCGWTRLKSPSPVPEPTTTLLFGIGLAGLAGIRRRERNKREGF
ncbi:PEP-CTERM sorting domain-containing protein [Desulfogranum mediterraneum]|uniref:PEP-CTERM sorting domain-containing protein n=1 Tax=Desulfogranum mediterraneum TaxID=160661 RepID=UPI00048CA0E9|nr:PEP-CTERM sorting domain-containing protein [Desulfogranum mediterraneum]